MITLDTVGHIPLNAFVDAVNRIYSEKDGKRSIWDVWMHANHHASATAKEIRKGAPWCDLRREIADFAMWLLTAVHKLEGQIGVPKPGDSEQDSVIRIGQKYSDLLWGRFPGCCPMCYWRRSIGFKEKRTDPQLRGACDCVYHEAVKLERAERRRCAKALRGFSKSNRNLQPEAIDDWQHLFASIFSLCLRHFSLSDLTFRLLEQMGQVSDALVRMYTYKESDWIRGEPSWRQIFLEDEVADLSSGLFALVEKLEMLRQSASEGRPSCGLTFDPGETPLKLSRLIWQRYGSEELGDFICPFDGGRTCGCPIIFVPSDRSVKALRGMAEDVLLT